MSEELIVPMSFIDKYFEGRPRDKEDFLKECRQQEQKPVEGMLLNFLKFITNKGYQIHDYDDGQLVAVIKNFINSWRFNQVGSSEQEQNPARKVSASPTLKQILAELEQEQKGVSFDEYLKQHPYELTRSFTKEDWGSSMYEQWKEGQKQKPPMDFKEVTGFNTPQELAAYEKGRKDEEAVIVKWIERWDGSTNSKMGELLYRETQEQKPVEQGDTLRVAEKGEGITIKQITGKKEAIAFAEWLWDDANPFIKMNRTDRWMQACGNSTTWTIEELYNMYLKTKEVNNE